MAAHRVPENNCGSIRCETKSDQALENEFNGGKAVPQSGRPGRNLADPVLDMLERGDIQA